MPGARRFAWASAAGGATATAVFCWMITNARFDFFAREPFGEIQDAQARSLFHGHWDVPRRVVGFEGFLVHGRYYTYFGPFLALLRMPVLLVTSALDGRLTIVSMLGALAVLLVAASHLHWQMRSVLRAERPVGRLEALGVGAFTFLIGAGSIVVFLGSRALVYHEVELWGIAWAIVATDALVAFARRPTRALAIAAGVATCGAMMTRVSIGVGAGVALACVAGAQLLRRLGRDRGLARLGPGADEHGHFHLTALLVGGLVAVALYAGVNVARFGSPYQLPLDKQVFTQLDAQRRAALAANGGSLFGLKFAPTDYLQYARPDALRLSSRFPWVDFPRHRATVIGNVTYDTIAPSSSIPASMPGFTVLAVIGVVALVWPRRARATIDLARFWPPIVGGVVGTAFVGTIAFVAHRYLADFFPPLLFAAIIGAQRVVSLLEDRPARRARIAATGIAVLLVVGAWISFGLGRVYQRPTRPGDPNYSRGVAAAVVGRSSTRN